MKSKKQKETRKARLTCFLTAAVGAGPACAAIAENEEAAVDDDLLAEVDGAEAVAAVAAGF